MILCLIRRRTLCAADVTLCDYMLDGATALVSAISIKPTLDAPLPKYFSKRCDRTAVFDRTQVVFAEGSFEWISFPRFATAIGLVM